MGFWNDRSKPEAKRQFRWLFSVGGFDPWVCKKVTKPSFTMTETKHNYLNHSFYYPGRIEWQTIDVTIVDPAAPDSAMTVMSMISSAGYQIPKDDTRQKTMSKKLGADVLGEPLIKQIDSDGDALETWILHNAWIKDVKFGELSYEDDAMTEITLTLRYDYAKLETKNPGNGNGVNGDKLTSFGTS